MPLKNFISGDLNICKFQAFLTILVFVLKGWDGGGHGQGEEANERLHGVVQGPEKDIRYYIIIVLYDSLWCKFNCVKILQSEANKIRESLG
jgi:hypothetical protein